MPNRLSLAVIVGLLMQLFSSPAIASNGAGGGAECGSPTIEKEAANGTPDSLKAALSKALENTMTWMQKNRVWVKGTDFEFWDIQSVKNSTNEERIGMYAKWLKGCNGNALLSAAVVTGNKENVDYLLSVGISPNAGTDEGIFMKCPSSGGANSGDNRSASGAPSRASCAPAKASGLHSPDRKRRKPKCHQYQRPNRS